VTVGEALADARTRAGLSVGEISERTRIRESVILGLEQDDYDACGGDLFVRGYVRVIADAVGIDAQPLINEYDQTHSGGSAWYRVPSTASASTSAPPAGADEPESEPDSGDGAKFEDIVPAESGAHTSLDLSDAIGTTTQTPNEASDEATTEALREEPDEALREAPDEAPAESDATEPDRPKTQPLKTDPSKTDPPQADPAEADPPKARLDDTADDIPAIRLDDTVSDIDPVPAEDPQEDPPPVEPPGKSGESSDKTTTVLPVAAASGPDLPDMPWAAKKTGGRGRRKMIGFGVLAVVVLAGIGVGVALSSGGGKASAGASSASPALKPTTASAGKGGGIADTIGNGQAKPTPSPAAAQQTKAPKAAKRAKPAAKAAPTRVLAVPLAEAFGPDGTSDGDNPQSAMNVVNTSSTQPWSTDWYATAEFGMLKSGTGLLLDMGAEDTITSVRVDLGPDSGANVQVLAGNVPALADMHVAASVDGAGGTTYFRLSSARDSRYLLIWFTKLPPGGSGYQASVYSVTVTGRR
jgi:cytoskeletal protein RodZ